MIRLRRALALCVAIGGCGVFGPEHSSNGQLAWQWRADFPNLIAGWSGTPASNGSEVFVEYPGRVVVALDGATGAERWRSPALGTSESSPVARNLVLAGSRLIVAEVAGVTALDIATGAVDWTFAPSSSGELGWQSADDNTYYFGGRDQLVTALALNTGAVRWSKDLDPTNAPQVVVFGSAVSGDTLYVAARQCQDGPCGPTRGLVVALDAATGAELWRYTTPEISSDAYAVVVAGPHLLISDMMGGGLYSINRFTTHLEWHVHGVFDWIGPQAPAAVSNDTAYFGMQDQNIYAIDLNTGTNLWTATASGGVDGVTICGSALFALHLGLTKLDRSTGRVVGTRGTGDDPEWPTNAAAGVAAGNIVVTGKHAVYAYSCAL